MNKVRPLSIALALVLSAGGLALTTTGCQGEVQAQVGVVPPPAPPAPKDTDGDGIPDVKDKCVTVPEDGLPPDKTDGCPSQDPDNDGILGDADKCPNEPETKNGYQDEDGCPDKAPVVQVKEKEIKITQKIMFAKGSAEIKGESKSLIENIANVIKKHDDINFIEIAGHASKEGSEFYNRNLTDRRAKAVMSAFTALGVPASRMRAVGYGFYCPIANGDSEEALEKNRRVEFKILIRNNKYTGVKWGGCEAAEKKGIHPKPLPPLKKDDKAQKKGPLKVSNKALKAATTSTTNKPATKK